MQILLIANRRGGIGKSTIAVAIAAGLAKKHPRQRVVVLDMDPQLHAVGNIAGRLQFPVEETAAAAIADDDLLLEFGIAPPALPGCLQVSPWYPNLFFIPNDEVLMMRVRANAPAHPETRERLLASVRTLEPIADYVVVDTGPMIDDLLLYLLDAAHWLIIPVTPKIGAIEGAIVLNAALQQRVQEGLSRAQLLGVVVNEFGDHRKLDRGGWQLLVEQFGKVVFRTPIPRSVDIESFQEYGRNPYARSGGSSAIQALEGFVAEVSTRLRRATGDAS